MTFACLCVCVCLSECLCVPLSGSSLPAFASSSRQPTPLLPTLPSLLHSLAILCHFCSAILTFLCNYGNFLPSKPFFSFLFLLNKPDTSLPYDHLITTKCCFVYIYSSFLVSFIISSIKSMMNTFLTSLVFSSIEEMRPGLLPLIPPISQSEEESR